MKKIRTTCPYCGTGCTLYLKVRDGKVVGVLPDEKGPGQGRLCIKGWSAHEFIHHPNRLTKPLIRDKNGEFKETDWNTALALIAEKLSKIKKEFGPDAIGVFGSAKATNEENFLIMKFARAVIGTNNVDHCARLCHASTVVGLAGVFGSGAMTNSIDELENAEAIFVIGSNTTEQHPLIGTRILRAVRKGAKLIVADPRFIDLAHFATIYMSQKPGTDVALINGMMNVIISEKLHDEEFVKTRTENFEAMKNVVEKYTPEYVEKITTIPAEKIREAARLYAKAEKAAIVYSMGITQHTTGVDNVVSTANLAMLTGNLGKESVGVNPLRGQNNVQGACDVGALPNVFSGYQRVDMDDLRKKFEDAWGVKLPPKPGLTIVEMINAAGDKIKAIYMMGENPMISDPDINHVKEQLEKLDFLVCQDIFLSETAQLADVVLPAASYAEKDGTYTSTERRVQRIRKAVDPPGEAKADWEIIQDVAKRMGYNGMNYASPKEIMDEIAKLTPSYGGIQYDRIEETGLQWPCPNREHPGSKFLHKDKFTRGLGLFTAVEFVPPAEQPDEEYPFILTTGRLLYQFHTGTMTRRSPTLETQAPEGFVELNPKDAQRLGIKDSDKVKVKSRRGEITIKAKVIERVQPSIVFIPFHFAETAANKLTIAALDPKAKIPELKVCAVRLEKL
ncbi:formate dehydrogenase subunit alpha [Candidatus Bathyarchaeota archaeon]|nr:formate dehydrogenase subunit alpha [Candidatus Bathyarchaeota archaeon]